MVDEADVEVDVDAADGWIEESEPEMYSSSISESSNWNPNDILTTDIARALCQASYATILTGQMVSEHVETKRDGANVLARTRYSHE